MVNQQFANSPDPAQEIVVAVMDALKAHTAMSKQARVVCRTHCGEGAPPEPAVKWPDYADSEVA